MGKKRITTVGFKKGDCGHCDRQMDINKSLKKYGISSKKRILQRETGSRVAPHTILDDGEGKVKVVTGVVEQREILKFMGNPKPKKKLFGSGSKKAKGKKAKKAKRKKRRSK